MTFSGLFDVIRIISNCVEHAVPSISKPVILYNVIYCHSVTIYMTTIKRIAKIIECLLCVKSCEISLAFGFPA